MHQWIFFSIMVFLGLLVPQKLWAQSVENTELQWLLCEPSAESFRNKTQSPIGKASSREVYYSETRHLDLLSLSAVVRVRVSGKKMKSTVKLNYPTDQNLPWDSLNGKDAKCEWDRHDQHFKVGCSLNAKRDRLTSVLSEDQKDYLSKERGFSDFHNLLVLGPVQSTEWSWPADFFADMEMNLEVIRGPENMTWIELSTRTPVKDSDAVFHAVQTWLQQHQVILCPSQSGKGEALIRALLRQVPP